MICLMDLLSECLYIFYVYMIYVFEIFVSCYFSLCGYDEINGGLIIYKPLSEYLVFWNRALYVYTYFMYINILNSQ